MPKCERCPRFISYEGECEVCEERADELAFDMPVIRCSHCGGSFSKTGFNLHRWNVHHRLGEFPKGRRVNPSS